MTYVYCAMITAATLAYIYTLLRKTNLDVAYDAGDTVVIGD